MKCNVLINKNSKLVKARGLRRIYLACGNSFRAINWMLKNEAAFKQELLLLIICVPVTCFLQVTIAEQLILLTSVIFIIFTEVINTAIEAVVDRVGAEIHPLSGLAKDLGSAAVMLSFIIAILIWLIILM